MRLDSSQQPEQLPTTESVSEKDETEARAMAVMTKQNQEEPKAGEHKTVSHLEQNPASKSGTPGSPQKDWGTEEAKVIRDMIFKESEYINHRLTWLVTLQGLLFASLGFAWKDGKEMIPVLGSLGIVTSLATGLSLYFAIKSIDTLLADERGMRELGYTGPRVIGHQDQSIVRLLLPWFLLPCAFTVAWFSVLWLRLR